MALSGTSISLPLENAALQKPSKLIAVKQEKHSSVKVLVQAKLDSISDAISQAIQDESISPAEYPKMLQEMEKNRKLKKEIWRQNKAKVRQISKRQRKELLGQGGKEGKKDTLQNIADNLGNQGGNVI